MTELSTDGAWMSSHMKSQKYELVLNVELMVNNHGCNKENWTWKG